MLFSYFSLSVPSVSCQDSDWQNKNQIDHPRISLLESTCHNMCIIIPLQFLQVTEDSDQAGEKKNATNTSKMIYYIAYFERAEFVFFKSEGSGNILFVSNMNTWLQH